MNEKIILLTSSANASDIRYTVSLSSFGDIGSVIFTNTDEGLNVSIEIGKTFRSKRYATEALKVAMSKVIDITEQDIFAYVDIDNSISQKLFLHAGYCKVAEIEVRSKRYVKFKYIR